MKTLITILLWLSLVGVASAQLPPVQTINTNQGIACNGISSQGPVTKCVPGWTYGCQANQVSNNILGTDGSRTSVLFQDTGTVPIVLVFGDTAAGNNGFVVQPGNSFLWSNIGRGNEPGRVTSGAVSVISSGASIPCVFMFTD
jgi:hypothetical protein